MQPLQTNCATTWPVCQERERPHGVCRCLSRARLSKQRKKHFVQFMAYLLAQNGPPAGGDHLLFERNWV